MSRHDDWEFRLIEYLKEVADRPFKRGEHDCAYFVAGAVKAITGNDPMTEFGSYTTLTGSKRVLTNAGFDGLTDAIASMFEETDTPEPGDIVVFESPEGDAAGIFQGKIIFAVAEDGLRQVSTALMTKAFSV